MNYKQLEVRVDGNLYKRPERNTGRRTGDFSSGLVLLLDSDIAHYVCGVIQGTTTKVDIQPLKSSLSAL